VWAIGAATVFLTAYYMSRLFFLAFYGKDRRETHGKKEVPHESPRIMLVPMVVLAGLSVLGGVLNLAFPPVKHVLDHFLEPVFYPNGEVPGPVVETSVKWILGAISVGLAVAGIGTAWAIAKLQAPTGWPVRLEPKPLVRAWFVDPLYEWLFAKPGRVLAAVSSVIVDPKLIDGVVNGTAKIIGVSGGGLRKLQTGYVRNYALSLAIGTALLLLWVLLWSAT
jgi:NADH-quinone oxidoreductase subunit L